MGKIPTTSPEYEIKKTNFRTFDKIVNRQKDNRHSKKAEFPSEFKHNGETINQPVDIANFFNTFFPELKKICPIAFMLTTSFMEHTRNIFGPQPI